VIKPFDTRVLHQQTSGQGCARNAAVCNGSPMQIHIQIAHSLLTEQQVIT
jgi:hypothetical protein